MGKGTIVSHKGDGLYSVRLRKSARHITDRIADIDAELVDVEAGIVDAASRVDEAEAALAARRSDIDGEILSINAKYADLGDAIRKGREDLEDAEDSVRVAQETLDYLTDRQAEDPDSVNDMQIADAEADVATATANRDAIQTQLDDDTQAWQERSQDLDRINALVAEAATLDESLRVVESILADLINQRTQLTADRVWLAGKMPLDETVEAWCADLTTDLTGEVGTVEIPGERSNPAATVHIRPGYDDRAAYTAAEQFAPLLTAKTHAQAETLLAVEQVDAAQAALVLGQARVTECQERLADLISRPKAQEDVYGYLEDLDGNPIPAPRGITDAEIVEAQGQLSAAQAQLPVLEGIVATMTAALNAARSAFETAAAALDAARAAETNPRNADGRLQSVAAAPGPFSWFFNQTILPAWEKWMPLYRVGVITEISGDHCTVSLDTATSSQQSIDVNRQPVLSGVPIRYMECNGAAFAVGDRVVVEFAYHDQNRPAVIGFESHPKPCSTHGLFANYTGSVLAWRGHRQAFIKNAALPPAYTFREDQSVVGGHIAVTGPVERNPDGTVKPGQKFDVFSVATSAQGWMPGRWPMGGPIYRNGKKLSFLTVSGVFDEAPFSPDQFSGVGVKVVTRNPGTPNEETIRRLVAVAISGQGAWESQAYYENALFNDDDPTHQTYVKPGWQGDYLICYSDPPYTDLVIAQHLRIDDYSYGPYWTTLTPERPVLFFFNESCTIAAGIKNRTNRSYTGQASGVQYLDIGADGTTATPRWEDHPADEAGGENSETWTGPGNNDTEYVRRQWARNPARAVAIGYVGDVEKRLTVESTYDLYGYYYNTRSSLVPRTGIVSQDDEVTTYVWRCGSTAIEETVSNHELLVWPYHSTVDRVTEHIYVYGVDLATEAIWHLKARGEYRAVNMNGKPTPTVVTVGNGKSITVYSGPEVKEQKPKPTSTSVGIGNPVDLVCCSFPYPVAMGHQHDTLFALDMPAYRYYSPAGDLFAAFYVDPARNPHDINGQGDIPAKSSWGTVGVA